MSPVNYTSVLTIINIHELKPSYVDPTLVEHTAQQVSVLSWLCPVYIPQGLACYVGVMLDCDKFLNEWVFYVDPAHNVRPILAQR